MHSTPDSVQPNHYTLSSGERLHYQTYHDDQLPVIIMIHGITGNHRGFQYIAPLLDEHHLVIPDLLGFGDSSLPRRDNWSIEGLARTTNEFVRSLELSEPPIILGHSMGGLVVASMVALAPELYSDVILISPVPTPVRLIDRRFVGAFLATLQYRLGSKSQLVEKHVVRSKPMSRLFSRVMMKTREPDMKRAIVAHHFENLDYFSDVEFYWYLQRDINKHGAIDAARTLATKRVLLIVGDSDSVTPLPEERRLAAAINPEQFVIIPKVGHLIHYEKAAEAAEAIRAFLSRRRSSR